MSRHVRVRHVPARHVQNRHVRVHHARAHRVRAHRVAWHPYARHSRYERTRLERIRRARVEREQARLERDRAYRERPDSAGRARAAEESARLDSPREEQVRSSASAVSEAAGAADLTSDGISEANLSPSSEASVPAEVAESEVSPENAPVASDHYLAETQEAEVTETIPPIPMRDGRLYVPPPLRGSLASLLRQNQRDEAEGLARIQNIAQLNAMRRDGQLVPLPVGEALTVNPHLPYDRRCARPWTVTFLANLAHAHFVRFDRPLQITSAVRPVSYQLRLVHINGNAAPAYGDTSSPHERGATIDIAKKGMTLSEIAWMRAYLLPLQQEGKLDVEEEFFQSCFHITVYESYIPSWRRHGRHVSTLLASGIQ